MNTDKTTAVGFFSTRQAARRLGVPPNRLNRAIWEGRLQEPAKGPGGAFCWTIDDIRRAAWVILRRDLDEVAKNRGAGHA